MSILKKPSNYDFSKQIMPKSCFDTDPNLPQPVYDAEYKHVEKRIKNVIFTKKLKNELDWVKFDTFGKRRSLP